MEELEQLLTEIRNEIQEIENKQREANEVVLDLNHELERYNAIVKENQLKIKHFNNEVCLIMCAGTTLYCGHPVTMSVLVLSLLFILSTPEVYSCVIHGSIHEGSMK